jgi:hypothetical protein
MTTFAQAVQNTPVTSKTANGAATYESSLSANTDLFFMIGASRGKDITSSFEKAYEENSDLAVRILMYARDVRGGAGERQTFRSLLTHLEVNHPQIIFDILPVIPFYGRWDDLLVFKTEAVRNAAFGFISYALADKKDALCAKWMPRQSTKEDNSATLLRNFMGLSPKDYRKFLVSLTNVVEQKMCAKEWNEIEFGKLPSLASARYNKAFARNAKESYDTYKAQLATGEAKINAGAIFPHDVIKTIKVGGEKEVALAQWDALPNFLGENFILPMVDVSGSMDCPIPGNPGLTCMNISVALGLYLCDKQKGAFKDMFLTFHETPKLEILKGNLVEKLEQLENASWGGSTNICAGFNKILEVAIKNNVPQSEMPKYLMVLSDMEFNVSDRNFNETIFESAKSKFKDAGYEMPKIVFWNLNARIENVPASKNDENVALISGFSTNVIKSVLAAKNFTPIGVMLETVMDERYNIAAVLEKNNKVTANVKP